MLPASLPGLAAKAINLALVQFDTSSDGGIDVGGDAVATDGDAITALRDLSNNGRDAIQDNSAKRPVVDYDVDAGLNLALFDNDQRLEVADPGAPVLHMFLVVRAATSGTRVIATRDTSNVTTKPAFEIEVGI